MCVCVPACVCDSGALESVCVGVSQFMQQEHLTVLESDYSLRTERSDSDGFLVNSCMHWVFLIKVFSVLESLMWIKWHNQVQSNIWLFYFEGALETQPPQRWLLTFIYIFFRHLRKEKKIRVVQHAMKCKRTFFLNGWSCSRTLPPTAKIKESCPVIKQNGVSAGFETTVSAPHFRSVCLEGVVLLNPQK